VQIALPELTKRRAKRKLRYQENHGFGETVSASSSLPISENSDGCARHVS